MKLTDYILHMQKIVEEKGNLEVVRWIDNDDYESTTQGWFSSYEDNPKNNVSDFACTWVNKEGKKEFATINDKGYIDCQIEEVYIVK